MKGWEPAEEYSFQKDPPYYELKHALIKINNN